MREREKEKKRKAEADKSTKEDIKREEERN